MSIAKHNLAMIHHVAMRLGDLVDSVVFLGGATMTLLISDTAAGDVRPTKDVDVIVEIATTAEYHRLAEQLRGRGFNEDTSEGAPLCRWLIDNIIVDVMPTDEATLGFSNRWYREAFAHAVHTVVEGVTIRVVTAPFFLATKLEAFRTRGREDFMASHDLEDIIALVDGRSELVEEWVLLRPPCGPIWPELFANYWPIRCSSTRCLAICQVMQRASSGCLC
jgi:predicted nucleotidyltransferase